MLSFLLTTLLAFHYIQTPTAPMHEAPAPEAPVISEAFFSEEIKVLETQDKWIKIETAADKCQGWIAEAIIERDKPYADCTCMTPIAQTNRANVQIYAERDIKSNLLFSLPFDCRLEAEDPFLDLEDPWIKIRLPYDKEAYVQREDVTLDLQGMAKEQMVEFSKQFLNLPYMQGGRTSLGLDAAGFSQMLYRQMGYSLPRSAQAQASWEEFEEIALSAAEPGDLIFWGRSKDEIEHVGIYLGNEQFIHATDTEQQPWLRISSLPFDQWPYQKILRLKP